MALNMAHIISVYIAGITGMWKAIPFGFIIGADPYTIAICTALGSMTTVVVLFYSGNAIKNWITNKIKKEKLEKKKGSFARLLDRFGIPGLGIIGTLFTGPIVTTIVGVILLKRDIRFLLFTLAGTAFWSVLITIIANYSVNFLETIT